jgi:Putative metallopeptidase
LIVNEFRFNISSIHNIGILILPTVLKRGIRMKKMNPLKIRQNSLNKNLLSFLIILSLIILVALACKFDLGQLEDKPNVKEDPQNTGEKKRPTGEKKKIDEDPDTRPTKNVTSKGQFVPQYSAIKNQSYVNFDASMKKQQILEGITDRLNKALALPEDVAVTFVDCGVANAFYSPQNKSITVCYEFMDLFYSIFKKMGKGEEDATQLMYGATTFFFLHELGHCLIDVYELPSTGREEDSADQLSMYVLMEEMGKEGRNAAIAGALVFDALAKNETAEAQTFADEHSLSSQRFFNLVCWMYGKDDNQFGFVVKENLLPEARAQRCNDEYTKLSKAWAKLVEPYRKR